MRFHVTTSDHDDDDAAAAVLPLPGCLVESSRPTDVFSLAYQLNSQPGTPRPARKATTARARDVLDFITAGNENCYSGSGKALTAASPCKQLLYDDDDGGGGEEDDCAAGPASSGGWGGGT
jgi:hypothetical protein